ncbi:TPA: DNA methyltransferase [Vibrio parahaemolyticus]|uniref:DNA methyltransferase n=1 Tax=Vibrio parahaemolyticus TaxID=670 RepID=UPI000A395C50|nr:DNA methyltransferase [Vibrio parahaemolyticus]MBM4936376.1 DNA methylase [Vibrio parahaemolyticus]OUJ41034.1 DNA methylase [Vibrio parahaemolyticus]
MISKLYETPLPASRTGPLYNAFSYPTKISPEAIAVFIATHTKPGATVLDTFGGSGTTGLAALLCDKPTDAMKKMAHKIGVTPEWGPREAQIYDIGVLGSFVANTLCSPPKSQDFTRAIKSFFSKADEKIGWMYEAHNLDGGDGYIRHVIWSDVLQCTHCDKELPYFDVCTQQEPLKFLDHFLCPFCSGKNEAKNCRRAHETVFDDFTNESVTRKKRIPVRVYGQSGKNKWQRDITEHDINIIDKIFSLSLPSSAPNEKIEWGDLYRSGYHHGITHLHHFYTRRNFYVISTLWELTLNYEKEIRDVLQLLILSYNSSHSTLMTRVVAKKGQKDFVLTGAQSGVLYVSSLPVEKNILVGLKRKSTAFEKAFELIRDSSSKVVVKNMSSEQLPIEDGSIDYVFTDPPFGDYIPYAELNQINELWLGSTTDRSKEIIVSKAQDKSVEQYGAMMSSVFSEIERTLKPHGKATVVFHSAKSKIWQGLANAYSKAGLIVKYTSVLDKLQASFKQTNSTISVKGDPLLLLTKGDVSMYSELDTYPIMEEVFRGVDLNDVDELTPERLYSRYINTCLKKGIHVEMDADEFYKAALVMLGDKS